MTAGNEVLYLLTATSAAEAASRLSFLEELNRRDEDARGQGRRDARRRAELQAAIGRAHMEIDVGLKLIEADRAALRRKMAETRKLVAKPGGQVEEIQAEISRIRPFAVCPVDGPHAVGDGFGIWHHHPKNQGGAPARPRRRGARGPPPAGRARCPRRGARVTDRPDLRCTPST